MPIGYRRDAMKGLIDASAPGDDQAYRAAFDTLLAITRRLHDRGVFIVFGTDTGGPVTYHRELELYQYAGMTPPEILTRATLDSGRYTGQDPAIVAQAHPKRSRTTPQPISARQALPTSRKPLLAVIRPDSAIKRL